MIRRIPLRLGKLRTFLFFFLVVILLSPIYIIPLFPINPPQGTPSKTEIPLSLLRNTRRFCRCKGRHDIDIGIARAEAEEHSLCSDEATLRGPGQKVISYSLYIAAHKRFGKIRTAPFHKGIEKNLKAMRDLYPGWVMRIYSNITLIPQEEGVEEQGWPWFSSLGSQLCNLICLNEMDLFWCDVRGIKLNISSNITRISRNLNLSTDLHPMFWRFLPINDPLVDIFISRDLDSLLISRERKAVSQWENRKDKALHIMRDHLTGHAAKILGGMWGMKTKDIEKEERKELEKQFVEIGSNNSNYMFDMTALSDIVYNPRYFWRILAHDSFFCKRFFETECLPFPDGGWNKSNPIHYVGEQIF